ncbi:MAG TPA: cytochrome c-type biogenesis protein CcmH [Gemmatimonadales bacterium]|nr:cytochrome c-type biogenesis protein CcmH [Gemmatimonadales bacterium]
MRASLTRRQLLAVGLGGLALPALARAQQGAGADTTRARPTAPADPLFDPNSLERREAIVEETANDATVKAAELKLACPCPCTLDVFTCRTTDFTCSYSPERHKEVVALVEQGMGVQQVLDAMVAKYGEEALMAPIPQGFNLVGYVLPASVVLGLGAVIVAILALRQRGGEAVPAVAPAAPDHATASEDEVARLERELRELDA